MAYLYIFLLFAYYGCLCFGGGGALVPIYIEDLVNTRNWMTLDEFGNLLAISQMTPGPIGINAATFFGFKNAGFLGGLAATCGLLFVPFFLMIFTVQSLQKWSETKLVDGIMTGLRPAVFGMIVAALITYWGMSVFNSQIPWEALLSYSPHIPEDFTVNYGGTVIFLLSSVVLYKTKASIGAVILGSAALGAVVC